MCPKNIPGTKGLAGESLLLSLTREQDRCSTCWVGAEAIPQMAKAQGSQAKVAKESQRIKHGRKTLAMYSLKYLWKRATARKCDQCDPNANEFWVSEARDCRRVPNLTSSSSLFRASAAGIPGLKGHGGSPRGWDDPWAPWAACIVLDTGDKPQNSLTCLSV